MERFDRLWTHVPHAVRAAVAWTYAGLAPTNDQNAKISELIRGNGNVLHPYFLSRTLFSSRLRARLLSTTENGKRKRAELPLREALQRAQRLDAINRVSYLEARCYMLNTLLRDADCMSMAHGLELRVPLIDHQLVGQMMALPGAWKIGRGTPKPLLVSALKAALPDSIVHRPKRGFTLPFQHWMRDALRGEIENAFATMSDGPLGPCLRPDAVQQVWKGFLRGETSWSRPWSVFVLERWCELNL
jgi:asparagine synthase (glutamine-hydrolysing)